jgi:hypothetical protein
MEGDHFEDLEVNGRVIRDRTCTCNVTLWRVRVTDVAVEEQQCISHKRHDFREKN